VKLYERSTDDLLNATRCGKLYSIIRICGRHIIAHRVRRRGSKLFVHHDEKITLERTPGSTLDVAIGDFAFCDSGSKSLEKTWSLWKMPS
jgi:hypothetical protein